MKIFLSHIHEEAPLALVIKDWIESSFSGLSHVFVSSDIKDLPAGLRWLNEISDALDESHSYIVLCSPHSIRRPWINFETGCAWIKDVPVLPICHSGLNKSDLPKPLSEFQALEISSDKFINDLLSSLATHMKIDKLPRIDINAMMTEIVKAISNIRYKNGISVISERVKEMDDPMLNRILEHIAALGDKGYPLEELATKFEMSEPKMEYYLDELISKTLLERSGSLMGLPPHYYLTKEGRKFLVEQGLL
jgi:hypothetical protein